MSESPYSEELLQQLADETEERRKAVAEETPEACVHQVVFYDNRIIQGHEEVETAVLRILADRKIGMFATGQHAASANPVAEVETVRTDAPPAYAEETPLPPAPAKKKRQRRIVPRLPEVRNGEVLPAAPMHVSKPRPPAEDRDWTRGYYDN